MLLYRQEARVRTDTSQYATTYTRSTYDAKDPTKDPRGEMKGEYFIGQRQLTVTHRSHYDTRTACYGRPRVVVVVVVVDPCLFFVFVLAYVRFLTHFIF